jgi:hypothetical protein
MAITMMGRGAAIDPQTLAERQKMADLMYQRSMVPAQNEQSWAQGLSRMLQGGIAGYESAQVDKDREAYKQQKVSDMQKLAGALGGGDYKSIIGQLSDPETQMMAFGLAKSDMDSQNQFNKQAQLKAYENALSQQGKQDDRDFELNKLGVQNEYTRANEGLKSELHLDQKKAEMDLDPVKSEQRRLSGYARVVSDPNAPQELKAIAQQQLDSSKSTVAAMQPAKNTVNVDVGGKGETKMEETFGGELGKSEAQRQLNNIKYGQLANDQLSTFDRINQYIEDGSLGNLQTTTLGQGLQSAASRLGLPNDSAKIGDFVQATNKQLVDMRGLLAGQGTISNYEQSLLKNTALNPNDTIETLKQKLYVFKQIANRVKLLGEITIQWKDRYGGIIRKGQNGESFDNAVQALYDRTPITSYEDMMKKKAEAASQGMGGAVNVE